MRLTASLSTQGVRERLGVGESEALRESDRRRRYLETYSRLVAPCRPTVRFSADLHAADTTWPDDDGDDPVIRLTTRPLEQPVTGFRRPVYDLIVQEALVVHELGHVLYTETGPFEATATELPRPERRLFARVWNVLEDGAVETQLRHRYAVADELRVLNANLYASGTLGYPDADGATRVGLFRAVLCGLADMAVYDSGRFARLAGDDDTLRLASLRDERVLAALVPTMRDVVEDVLAASDPAVRTRLVRSFWDELSAAMTGSEMSGTSATALDGLIDADGTVSTVDTTRAPEGAVERLQEAAEEARGTFAGKPDDADARFADAREASALSRVDTRRTVRRRTARVAGTRPGTDSTTDGADESAPHGSRSPGDDGRASDGAAVETPDTGVTSDERTTAPGATKPGVPAEAAAATDDGAPEAASAPGTTRGPDPDGSPGEGEDGPGQADGDEGGSAATGGPVAESEMRERYREELAAEATEVDGGEARVDAVETYLETLTELAADEPETPTMRVVERDDHDGYDRDRWETARRSARRLARRFRSRLLEQRRDSVRPRQRRGTLDRGRLTAATRGRPDVFSRTVEGDSRAYDCTLVVDRSGSMADDGIEAVERAAATVALALEDVGVSVTVLDLHDSTVRLVNAAEEDVAAARHTLLTGEASGSTPLSTALQIERTRLQETGVENPFVVVLTDGRPDDERRYLDELDAVTFPVVGVYLTDSAAVQAGAHEADERYFHGVALVEDWTDLDRRLRDLTEQILF